MTNDYKQTTVSLVLSQHKSQMGFTACALAVSSIFATIGLMAPFVFTRSPLPSMATPPRKIYRALDRALRRRPPMALPTFVDLGSGDGEAVYQALRVGYGRAIGVELNLTLFLWSNLRRWLFWPKEFRQRSSFYYQDFFSYNLHAASTIMVFGVPRLMEPISRKLSLECVTGTVILSYRFPLPITTDRSTDIVHADLISSVEEMRTYVVK